MVKFGVFPTSLVRWNRGRCKDKKFRKLVCPRPLTEAFPIFPEEGASILPMAVGQGREQDKNNREAERPHCTWQKGMKASTQFATSYLGPLGARL